MHLGLRLFFGFFVVAGIAAVLLLRVFLAEVKPSVREVMEDVLVDSANLLAEQAAPDLRALAPGATLDGTRFARGVHAYQGRPVDAVIWGLHKRTLDLGVYVTDAAGRVVFESGAAAVPGADYSRWRDVARTLRGEYGARTTREVVSDEASSVLYVAAPVEEGGRVIGVLTVAKPVLGVQPFIDRAEHKIAVAGAVLLASSLAIGAAVTGWAVHAVRRLRRYAQQVRAGERQPVPALPGELGELALAMGAMRDRLDGRSRVEQAVRALTHELKSPLTAITGAAELLRDDLPVADRHRFADQVGDEAGRLRALVERVLELAKLESLDAPQHLASVVLLDVARRAAAAAAPLLQQRSIRLQWTAEDAVPLAGDAWLLELALSNLLGNAAEYAPDGSVIEIGVAREAGEAVFRLRDTGPGVPAFAMPHLGERFFSTAGPRSGHKGSGLGLAIVRQVAALHRGRVGFADAGPGLEVRLVLPV